MLREQPCAEQTAKTQKNYKSGLRDAPKNLANTKVAGAQSVRDSKYSRSVEYEGELMIRQIILRCPQYPKTVKRKKIKSADEQEKAAPKSKRWIARRANDKPRSVKYESECDQRYKNKPRRVMPLCNGIPQNIIVENAISKLRLKCL